MPPLECRLLRIRTRRDDMRRAEGSLKFHSKLISAKLPSLLEAMHAALRNHASIAQKLSAHISGCWTKQVITYLGRLNDTRPISSKKGCRVIDANRIMSGGKSSAEHQTRPTSPSRSSTSLANLVWIASAPDPGPSNGSSLPDTDAV